MIDISLRRSAQSINKRDKTENNEGLVLKKGSVHYSKLSTTSVLISASASAFNYQSHS